VLGRLRIRFVRSTRRFSVSSANVVGLSEASTTRP
jgi:hypothetical protein